MPDTRSFDWTRSIASGVVASIVIITGSFLAGRANEGFGVFVVMLTAATAGGITWALPSLRARAAGTVVCLVVFALVAPNVADSLEDEVNGSPTTSTPSPEEPTTPTNRGETSTTRAIGEGTTTTAASAPGTSSPTTNVGVALLSTQDVEGDGGDLAPDGDFDNDQLICDQQELPPGTYDGERSVAFSFPSDGLGSSTLWQGITAFDSEDEAVAAFNAAKSVIQSCLGSTWENRGGPQQFLASEAEISLPADEYFNYSWTFDGQGRVGEHLLVRDGSVVMTLYVIRHQPTEGALQSAQTVLRKYSTVAVEQLRGVTEA